MASVFPGAIDSFSTYTDNVDVPHASHYNDMADAIVAIETALGSRLSAVMNTGEVRLWAGEYENPPAGWLVCSGAAVSRTQYSELFDLIGTTYGSGNGSTTFNLPDLDDQFAVGAKQDDSGVAKSNIEGSLAKTGGSQTQPPTSSFAGSDRGVNDGANHRLAGHDHTFTPRFVALVHIIKT